MNYESSILSDWYLLFHYGSADEILSGLGFDVSCLPPGCLEFPVATVDAAGEAKSAERALDLGCAVGRSTFELSRTCDEVIGIDFSEAFVGAAEAIRRGETLTYRRYSEMHLSEFLEAKLPSGSNPELASFEVGDAMDLRSDLGDFDLVHAANLLCRLPEPHRLTARLPELVRPGGFLVMATPATWMEQYTPKSHQPEGYTLEYLKHHLDSEFDLQSVEEIPFLIREHQRKLQLSTSQTSVWKRRS